MWAAWAVTIIQTDWWAERRQRLVGEGPPLACRELGDQSEASAELREADLKASVALEPSREGQIPRDKNENGETDTGTWELVLSCHYVTAPESEWHGEVSPFLYVPLNIVFEFCINTKLQKLKWAGTDKRRFYLRFQEKFTMQTRFFLLARWLQLP